MSFLLNTPADQQAMLQAIGVDAVERLFDPIPRELRLGRPLDLPPALVELELTEHLQHLAATNVSCDERVCFLGGGSYDHFVPAVVDAIASRGEFFTSYTPYQPEASQGNLQAFFEYQTLITQLTGMQVSNASLYDGGTAAVEAVFMAQGATGRRGKVVVLGGVHPEYRQILATYLNHLNTEVVTVPVKNGVSPLADVAAALDEHTACLLAQQPNFLGCVEEVEALGKLAKEKGAAFVVSVDPISLGILKRPGDYGADIVVAEGQSLGNYMAFGGPYLGILACREEFVRRMPGRIAGQTVDRGGQRCWVLTLQTREQHIRREKATSNICTNQGLLALRSSIYLAVLGPQGLRETAELCLQKARYAAGRISAGSRCTLAFDTPTFKEFVVRDKEKRVTELLASAAESGYYAGVPLGTWYPELDDCFLVAVTEKRSREEIDGWASALAGSKRGAERRAVAHA